ncbi:NUDIX hydrolase [Alkalihalobacillus sp. FSL W8-0930]
MLFIFTSAAFIYNDDGHILLKKDPKRGWELPGGHVNNNESLKRAAIREVKEETGFNVEIHSFCGMSHEQSKAVCNYFWKGIVISGEPTLNSESLDIRFFSYTEALSVITNSDFREELIYCVEVPGFLLTLN